MTTHAFTARGLTFLESFVAYSSSRRITSRLLKAGGTETTGPGTCRALPNSYRAIEQSLRSFILQLSNRSEQRSPAGRARQRARPESGTSPPAGAKTYRPFLGSRGSESSAAISRRFVTPHQPFSPQFFLAAFQPVLEASYNRTRQSKRSQWQLCDPIHRALRYPSLPLEYKGQ